MKLNRLLEITNDRETCEFCPDPTWCENICTRCNKVKPITEEKMQEYYREIRKVLTENANLRGDLELAVQDINNMATGKYKVCNFCGRIECQEEKCHFQWRGAEE